MSNDITGIVPVSTLTARTPQKDDSILIPTSTRHHQKDWKVIFRQTARTLGAILLQF